MKRIISNSIVAAGLTAISCASAPKRVAEPNAVETSASREEPSEGSPEGSREGAVREADSSSDSSASSSSAADSRDSDSPVSRSSESSESSGAQGPLPAPRSAGAAAVSDGDEPGAGKCRESETKLVLAVDRKTVSLEDGRLRAQMDGPICNLVMKITSKDGQLLLEKAFRYSGAERELRWSPVARDQIEKVEIRITAADGAYQSVLLIPWSVSIDHEEVQFDTNKSVIRESGVASLSESLSKINDVLAKVEGKGLGTITLFIAGHTDTQGSDEHNMVLSRNRAQAIASWFLKKGLCIPIAYEGFGESALKKLTADNFDEQANRRADYILAVEPPTIKKGATPAWKWLSKGC